MVTSWYSCGIGTEQIGICSTIEVFKIVVVPSIEEQNKELLTHPFLCQLTPETGIQQTGVCMLYKQ